MKKSEVKIFGIGQGGINSLDHLQTVYASKLKDVDLISCDTAMYDVFYSLVQHKIHLGKSILGVGIGETHSAEQAVKESLDRISPILDCNTKILVILCGAGGAAGSGASYMLAKLAREKGILVVTVVSRPFRYEGMKKVERADVAIKKLRKQSHILTVIDNNKLRTVYGELTRTGAYKKLNEVLSLVTLLYCSLIKSHPSCTSNFKKLDTKFSEVISTYSRFYLGIDISQLILV